MPSSEPPGSLNDPAINAVVKRTICFLATRSEIERDLLLGVMAREVSLPSNSIRTHINLLKAMQLAQGIEAVQAAKST